MMRKLFGGFLTLIIVSTSFPLHPFAAEISGEWAAYKEDCAKAPGNKDTVTITKSKLSGIEWECKVLKRSKKGGATVDSVMCTDGNGTQKDTVKYRLDKNGALSVHWGNGSSDVYQYKCK